MTTEEIEQLTEEAFRERDGGDKGSKARKSFNAFLEQGVSMESALRYSLENKPTTI